MNPAQNKAPGERHSGDLYPTPDALALAICERLRETIGAVDLIVEPSAGAGAFVRAARATWGDAAWIVAVEPETRLPEMPGANVLLDCRWEDEPNEEDLRLDDAAVIVSVATPRALVVGNPPFSCWESHARLALERLPEGGHLAFLLRASAPVGSDAGERLLQDYPLLATWPIRPRPSFTGDGGTDGAEYAVYVWRKGHATGGEAPRVLRWERPPTTPEMRALKRARDAETRARTVAKALAKATTEQLVEELARREREAA